MIDTEWCFGNIFKRLRTKINHDSPIILYNPIGNIFDHIISEVLSEYLFINDDVSKVLFNFDYTAHNSVFLQAQDIIDIHNSHTDLIIFNHKNISDIKKEDHIILNNNLKNTYIINFDPLSNNVFNQSLNIDYPLPTIQTQNNMRRKDILIIDNNNSPYIKNMFNNLSNSFSADIVTSLGSNIQHAYNLLSEYNIVIELSNRINMLCARYAGCNVITSQNFAQYPDSNDYFYLRHNDDLVGLIKQILKQKDKQKTSDIRNTSLDFSNKFKEYLCA